MLLYLTGRLEGVACLVLQQYLVKVLVATIPPLLVVNLEGLAGADPHGWDILQSADRHARASGGRMVVVSGGVLPDQGDGSLDVVASTDQALTAITTYQRDHRP